MNQVKTSQEERLLSEQERIAFKMISSGKDLHGQRAIALLAIDGGASQAEAARQAGLTPGQVKYWLGKFRQVRMQIFPDELLTAEAQEKAPGETAAAGKPKKSGKAKTKKKKQKPAKKTKAKKAKKPKKKKEISKKKKKGKDKKKKGKK